MKKAIGMLVMLMGLTANAQTNQPQDSLEFVKAYEFLTNGQITNTKVENGKVKCEKIDYSDACLQTSVNLENSTLTVTNTTNGDKFVYSLKVESALLYNDYGAFEYDTNSKLKY